MAAVARRRMSGAARAKLPPELGLQAPGGVARPLLLLLLLVPAAMSSGKGGVGAGRRRGAGAGRERAGWGRGASECRAREAVSGWGRLPGGV